MLEADLAAQRVGHVDGTVQFGQPSAVSDVYVDVDGHVDIAGWLHELGICSVSRESAYEELEILHARRCDGEGTYICARVSESLSMRMWTASELFSSTCCDKYKSAFGRPGGQEDYAVRTDPNRKGNGEGFVKRAELEHQIRVGPGAVRAHRA